MSFIDSFNAGMTAGWSVTVSGVSFGASLDTTPTSRLGLSNCGTAAWVSVTSVACFLTRGDGIEHEATVTAVGVMGTRTSTFRYDGTTAMLSLLFCAIVVFFRQSQLMTVLSCSPQRRRSVSFRRPTQV